MKSPLKITLFVCSEALQRRLSRAKARHYQPKARLPTSCS